MRGDHIRIQRWLGYWHHGIEVGRNRVIHFSGELFAKINAQVVETSMEEFCDGDGEVEVVSYGQCSPTTTVLDRARRLLGRRGYNLLHNNCEHFAHYCKTGIWRSKQADLGRIIVGSAGAVLMPMPTGVALCYDAYRAHKSRSE